ncbi:MAG: hypothetical protein ACLTAK_01340 [Bacilli bacterium]
MKDILAQIINFDEKQITEKETGKVTVMYEVNYAVKTDPYKGHYGPTILTSYASEGAFKVLNEKLNKIVKIDLQDKPLFGKPNTFKKVVAKVDGVDVRNF